ncbi:His-Xaa-Ser system radical SAM maturase HxsB [Patescibacteria group bacterium]|nr:His-Xaa-Ser system radical SAM maturase HxsB [Patescibacteria group bacterium]
MEKAQRKENNNLFLKKIDYTGLGSFQFKKLAGEILLSNDSGSWLWLGKKDFSRFLSGKIKKGEKIYRELAAKGFFRPDKKKLVEMAGQYLKLNYSVWRGPSLFIVVLTQRCNHRCVYCQAVPEHPRRRGFDMSCATAKKTLNLIFKTPSPFVRIEFQGGEPLLNWPILQYIVDYAKFLNRSREKNLQLSLVSNLTLLDEKKLKFLLNEEIDICCSFDGPAKVHNKNRICLNGTNSHGVVVGQIKKIRQAVKDRGRAGSLNALVTVSRLSLPYGREIIDEYIKRGFNNIFLRPLSPLGLSKQTWQTIGYGAQDFIQFYRQALDYILKLNLAGHLLIERGVCHILKKILNQEDPAYMEMRSPCGAGIGQMAFDYNGKIYTCDEGRMAAKMDRDNFKLGDINSSYRQLIDNEVTKTMCLASLLDNQAGCSDCVYKPYCGTCPLINFMEYGTIFPVMPATMRCQINKAVFDYIFLKMRSKKYLDIFKRWIGDNSGLKN